MSRPADENIPGVLATDAVAVRILRAADLPEIIRIDRRITGRSREGYYARKLETALRESGVGISLVAELDAHVVGFLLASLYYGEFGRPEPVAVLDTVGVHPDFRGRQVGAALLRQLVQNCRALGVEHVETLVDWDQGELLGFLRQQGFAPVPRLCLRRALTPEVRT